MNLHSAKEILKKLLISRGFNSSTDRDKFVNPNYSDLYGTEELPDINVAVNRIILAKKNSEKVCIYGDYDVDGLTATTLLLDAFSDFGIETISYIPDRFSEGYGLSAKSMEFLASEGTTLIITVDCGSKSHKEIKKAYSLNMDVIVTDHHSVGDTLPECVAVINPKRNDSKYPFKQLAGVGVAFKLVQALQTKLSGVKPGQEKWLLDLVALGTTCDVVPLTDENRILVKWGLEVARKSRRPAYGALSSVSGSEKSTLDTETFGFRFGPRLNAAGRLETAQKSLDLLRATNTTESMSLATQLDTLNTQRRSEQDRVFEQVILAAQNYEEDDVLVLIGEDWSQGIVGIVASKTLTRFKKPSFILQDLGKESKGSARSFGGFHLDHALNKLSALTLKGGGHAMAAGVTLKTENVNAFREQINKYYKSLNLKDQAKFLEVKTEIQLTDLSLIDENLVTTLDKMAPFGLDNEKPVFESKLTVVEARAVGADGTHLKAVLQDKSGVEIDAIGFGLAKNFDFEALNVKAKFRIGLNTFNSRTNVQLELLQIISSN